jgi:acyl dehydratase
MEKPELLYDELQIGRKFPTLSFPISPELVGAYIKSVGDDNPIFFDNQAAIDQHLEGAIAPPGVWGIWGRQSYLTAYRMPGGGVLAGQDMVYLRPVRVGDVLTVEAEVTARFQKGEKNFVTIESKASDTAGRLCGIVRVTAIWPR